MVLKRTSVKFYSKLMKTSDRWSEIIVSKKSVITCIVKILGV